jgi:lysophospholipase L1-like esterase
MQTILAFGDSLTWGFEAGTWKRHGFEDRWPNAMAEVLGSGFRVIEEGMNGRTTVFPDPTCEADRNGAVALPILLESHQPLDLVIIMLGTNDIKYANRCRAFDASLGMQRLVTLVRNHDYNPGSAVPKIMLVSPPHIVATKDGFFNDLWGHAIDESKLFAKHYSRVAQEMDCGFFDAASVVNADATDGGHLDAANTRKLGQAMAPAVRDLLKN